MQVAYLSSAYMSNFFSNMHVEKSHHFIVDAKRLSTQHHLIRALFVELPQPCASLVRVHGALAAFRQRSSSRSRLRPKEMPNGRHERGTPSILSPAASMRHPPASHSLMRQCRPF